METKDPNLIELGPGAIRKDGFPAGISLYTDSGFKRYYPIAHALGGNLPKDKVIRFFKKELANPNLTVIGANLLYDLEWLRFLGIEVKGKLRDIQLAEPLIDEESYDGYDLDSLCIKYLKTRKNEDLLKLAASAYGVDPKADLWQLHSKYVGEYAEYDAEATYKIYEEQCKILDAENLWPIFNLECDLLPILLDMRFHGVRVDLNRASLLKTELALKENKALEKIRREVGWKIDVWSSDHLQEVAQKNNWSFPRTLKGNASFQKKFLEQSDNPFFNQVRAIRNLNRLRSVYVEKLIYKFAINGRIHASFQQLRDDDGGTRTGRFSSDTPNLQQIPARDKEVAPLIRAMFIPEEGEKWAKLDYSQQEPRISVHYAYLLKLRGAAEARQAYIADKKMDMYKHISAEAKIERHSGKVLFLGIEYGEGKDKMSRDLGKPEEECERLKRVFNEANPWVKGLADKCMDRAKQNRFITTLLGRRARFSFYEPSDVFDRRKRGEVVVPIKGMDAAALKWPNSPLQLAYVYKALNKLIQGSAADMTKAAMRQNYYENKKIPLSTVHDELNYSVGYEKEAHILQHTMENCVDLTVPIYAELSLGEHWK